MISKETDQLILESADITRCLAFYLPQFHPIPENDAWWGKGFTEWHNVTKAQPRFSGHYQPRRPSELGYYDLRVTETRAEQASLAQEHGIHGFVYYHYWFHGQRLLNRPVDEILATREPNHPFCLCWANETWSTTWGPTYGSQSRSNRERTTLIEQQYSQTDHLAHINWLAKAFEDERYIKIDGKPIFLVYRPSLIPELTRVAELWRKEIRRRGFGDIYLCAAQPFPDDRQSPAQFGFDAAVEIQPDPRRRQPLTLANGEASTEYLFDYATAKNISLQQEQPDYLRYPCVIPNWDNTARRASGATIYVDSTPELYGQWILQTLLRQLTATQYTTSAQENFLFINSWNEWAEGSQLEPDEKWGREYLEAHRTALITYLLLRHELATTNQKES